MRIAKVRGTVVSTHKVQSLTGVKLLFLQYVDDEGKLLPQFEVAGDTVGAGIDEWVLVTRGSGARQDNKQENHLPLDAMVVGIIDTVSVDNRLLYGGKKSKEEYPVLNK